MKFSEIFPRDAPNPFENCIYVSELGGAETFYNYMIVYYGECPVQDDSETVKNQIELFFAVNEYKHRGLLATTQYDYDAIKNYDMTETETGTNSGVRETTTTATALSTDKTTQFNDDDLKVGGSVESESGGSGSETTTGNTERTLTRSGNIGITTTQELIKSERNIVDFTIIKLICENLIDEISTILY